MSRKRKFRELKTSDEQKALLEKSAPKSTQHVTKWSLNKDRFHFRISDHCIVRTFSTGLTGTEIKAATRLFRMIVLPGIKVHTRDRFASCHELLRHFLTICKAFILRQVSFAGCRLKM